jgi:uncharacterized protein
MSGMKTRLQIVARSPSAAAKGTPSSSQPQPVMVSGRWLLVALSATIAAAALCAWAALCLLFWQGSWQLLYCPSSAIARTPASAGLSFESIAFAIGEDGTPQLNGWWVPATQGAAFSRFTVLLLHSQTGNIGDTADALVRLHAIGVNVLAFDYRGYGQSKFIRPSEVRWRQDTASALNYLTSTRHVDSNVIVLDGQGLGANLALEVADAHPELAGVIVESPIASPMNTIFQDSRAKLVPARLLVRDRYNLYAAADGVRIPVLWLEGYSPNEPNGLRGEPPAYRQIADHKTLVWLNPQLHADKDFADALTRWLDDLPHHASVKNN